MPTPRRPRRLWDAYRFPGFGPSSTAVVAVAHSLLRTIYHVLAESTDYREPGADYYDRRQTARTTRRAVAQLERLGYRVTLAPAA